MEIKDFNSAPASAGEMSRTELMDRVIPDDLDDIYIRRTIQTDMGIDVLYSVGPLHVPCRLVLVRVGQRYQCYAPEHARRAGTPAILDRVNRDLRSETD